MLCEFKTYTNCKVIGIFKTIRSYEGLMWPLFFIECLYLSGIDKVGS